MKTSVVAVLAAIAVALAVAEATSVPFTSCGTASDPVTLSSVDVDGSLSPGQTVSLTASGTTKVCGEIRCGLA